MGKIKTRVVLLLLFQFEFLLFIFILIALARTSKAMLNKSGESWKGNKKESKLEKKAKRSLFADDMILCIENPKDVIRKLLKFINEFDKYAGYRINIQKFLAFLYTISKGKLHGSKQFGVKTPLQALLSPFYTE